jgi:hypothetical protein
MQNIRGKMNNTTNFASALDKFAEKIDFTKLEGNPDAFYKAGVAFVENGQFDDAIVEFLKIIKTVSHQESMFLDAVKELKSMGFSSTDISAITGIPESEETKDAVKENLISENNPSPAGKSIGTILAIAGILFLISFFAGDGETAGFLQCIVIPGGTFIAIVLALLIVNINSPTIKEKSSAQVRRDESTPLVEGESAENVKKQQSEEVGSTLNAAFLSGMAGVLFVIAGVYLINDNKVPFDSLNNLILLVCIFVVPIFSLIGVAIHKSRRSKK